MPATAAALEALVPRRLLGEVDRRRDPAPPRPATSASAWSSRRSCTSAGLLRRIGAGITTTDWAWIGQLAGQQLFYPPNVAGWDDTRWLDTATFLGRWIGVSRLLQDHQRNPIARRPGAPPDAAALVDQALAFWRNPPLSPRHAAAARRVRPAVRSPTATADWEQKAYPALVENALRQLIAASPDLQTA